MKKGKVKVVKGPGSNSQMGGTRVRSDAISGGKLLRSQAKGTRKLRKSVIEEDFGDLPIR